MGMTRTMVGSFYKNWKLRAIFDFMVTTHEPWYQFQNKEFSFAEDVWWSYSSSFAGASGLVHFDEEGERNVDYSIYDLQYVGNTVLFVPILHFESQTKSVRYQPKFS